MKLSKRPKRKIPPEVIAYVDLEMRVAKLEKLINMKVNELNKSDVIKPVCDCTNPIIGTSKYKCGRCGRDLIIKLKR